MMTDWLEHMGDSELILSSMNMLPPHIYIDHQEHQETKLNFFITVTHSTHNLIGGETILRSENLRNCENHGRPGIHILLDTEASCWNRRVTRGPSWFQPGSANGYPPIPQISDFYFFCTLLPQDWSGWSLVYNLSLCFGVQELAGLSVASAIAEVNLLGCILFGLVPL